MAFILLKGYFPETMRLSTFNDFLKNISKSLKKDLNIPLTKMDKEKN